MWGEALLPARGLTMLHSGSKQGKSMLTLNLALALARGDREFLGHSLLPGQHKTVVFQGEIHLRGIYERASTMLDIMANAGGCPPIVRRSIIVNETRQLKLETDAVFREFRDFIRWYKPSLVIIDPLAHVLTENENDNAIVGRQLRKLATLRDDPGCAIILVHHDSKQSESTGMRSPRQRSRGADVLNADPDSILSLVPLGQDPGFGPKSRLTPAGRYGKTVDPFPIVLNENTLWFELSRGDRGDVNLLASWIEEAGGAMLESTLIEKINEEWDYEREARKSGQPTRNRTAKKAIERAVKKGIIAARVEADVRTYVKGDDVNEDSE